METACSFRSRANMPMSGTVVARGREAVVADNRAPYRQLRAQPHRLGVAAWRSAPNAARLA